MTRDKTINRRTVNVGLAATIVLLVASWEASTTAAQNPMSPPAVCQSALQTGEFPMSSAWQPPVSANHGTQEFERSTVVTFPQDVLSVTVELWGAGGGGGGGSDDSYTEGGAGGGGGASGGYVRTAIRLTPGRSYALIVGRGGAGGTAVGNGAAIAARGRDGGDSAVCDGGSPIIVAPGGSGGETARTNGHGGEGGQAGTNAALGPVALTGFQRPGTRGMTGMAPLLHYQGLGGLGGKAPRGSVDTWAAAGGAGGAGARRPWPAAGGSAGKDGGIIVTW